jgi:lipoprotein-releasing system permease protein
MAAFNAPFFIARRYFDSNPEQNRFLFNWGFTKVLSAISMAAVCLGTAALVTVLSVFNGMEALTKSLFRQHNAELRIEARQGRSFPATDSLLRVLERVPHVEAITEVIEDNALLRYNDAQMVVKLKGVGGNFLHQYRQLDSAVVIGEAALTAEGQARALVGIGIYHQMNMRLGDRSKAMQFWYPKKGKQNLLNPAKAFARQSILPGGVLSIEQQFDLNYVLVPLAFMQQLVDYQEERTYLEVRATQPQYIAEVQQDLQALLGPGFLVKNAEEQQANILRAVNIEKLFVMLAFLVLIGLASFNIFASLAILALEKRRDIAILKSMGASERGIRAIFLYEGLLIGGTGTLAGLLLGGGLCLLQAEFGLVGMGVQTAIINAYPIVLEWPDFLLSGTAIFGITLLASWIPARNAARTDVGLHL